jgi:hypothetical protein
MAKPLCDGPVWQKRVLPISLFGFHKERLMKFKLNVLSLEGRDFPSAVSEPLTLGPAVAASVDTGYNPVEHTSANTV